VTALRSYLFVPGDSEVKLAGAERYAADALILDLEDSVSPARKAAARAMTAAYLRDASKRRGPRCYVRINALDSGFAEADLAAVVAARPDGIVLPKSEPAFLKVLDDRLGTLEVAHRLAAGAIKVVAIATETAPAVFAIGHYAGVSARLQALTWGGEDLAASLGAVNRGPNGYEDTFRLAMSLCVLGASAANVDAIDAACMDFADLAALERECYAARRAGFTAKLAIHPRQVPIINAAFTPAAEEVAWARRVVEAFHERPELGVISIDGKVIDRPHLRLAERLLRRL
jgi:citrate lyase subunit beta/citryl-CoA lyase